MNTYKPEDCQVSISILDIIPGIVNLAIELVPLPCIRLWMLEGIFQSRKLLAPVIVEPEALVTTPCWLTFWKGNHLSEIQTVVMGLVLPLNPTAAGV